MEGKIYPPSVIIIIIIIIIIVSNIIRNNKYVEVLQERTHLIQRCYFQVTRRSSTFKRETILELDE